MLLDQQVRQPGTSLPTAVRESAVLAGSRGPRADLALLARVLDALLRLPDSALGQHYYQVPGECLAFPSESQDVP